MRSIALLLLLAAAPPAHARVVGGVDLPDTATVGGRRLQLNGAGVRRKFIFSVYVSALYVETPSSDPAAILATGAPWALTLHFLRDVDHDRIEGAYRDAFDAQPPALAARLRAGLRQLRSDLLDGLEMKSGQEMTFAWVPGEGAKISAAGRAAVVPDKAFADWLLLMWIGDQADDGGLRDALLGRRAPPAYAYGTGTGRP